MVKENCYTKKAFFTRVQRIISRTARSNQSRKSWNARLKAERLVILDQVTSFYLFLAYNLLSVMLFETV